MNVDYVSKRSMRITGAILALIGIICFSLIPLSITHEHLARLPSANPVNAVLAGMICILGAVFFFRLAACNNMRLDLAEHDPNGRSAIQKRFSYVDDSGGIGGPVTRDELIDLIKKGKITPLTQVWDDVRSKGWNGRWKPAWMALGIPREPAKLGDFDAWHQSS